MIVNQCGNCKFESTGRCKINPPFDNKGYTMWPRVDHYDWCGQFKVSKDAIEQEKYNKPRIKNIIKWWWKDLWKKKK